MSLRRARSPEKLVEWVRANFAPSQKKYWKCKFYKHFANRNARPRKTRASTEDDDPCLDEFRVCFKLGVRDKDHKRKIIVNAVRHLERVFSDSAAAADAEASAPDHDVAVLGAAARSNATPPPDGASEERLCNQSSATKFGDRISAIKYLLELDYLTHGFDDRLIQNKLKLEYVHLPFIEGNPCVRVSTVIAWHKKSLPTEEDWEGMITDLDLKKELGEHWFSWRCCMPPTWISKLNQRRRASNTEGDTEAYSDGRM